MIIIEYLKNLLDIYLDTAIWLMLGLSFAALIKGKIPDSLIKRWLSSHNTAGVLRGALIGAPLPLCSCGVLPTAIGLKRSGASKPATVSFLVATPETGVDSVTVSYALPGPVMAVIRPICALFTAITSGLLVLFFDKDDVTQKKQPVESNQAQTSCCTTQQAPEQTPSTSCCSSDKSKATNLKA